MPEYTPQQATIIFNREALSQWEAGLVASLGSPHPEIDELYHHVTLSDGHEAKLKIFRPRSGRVDAPRPLVVPFHGGGFGCGSIEMCTRPGREFALAFNAVVVSASYRLAPEHLFSQSVLDGREVVRWLDTHASHEAILADPSAGFVVGGLSAGGTLASIAPTQLAGTLRHNITGIFLGIPTLLTKEIVPDKYKDLWTSRFDGTTDPAITQSWVDENVEAIGLDPFSPYFSVLNSSTGVHGLPRTYIQVGGRDVFRDDGVVYQKILADAEVDAKVDVHPEEGHSWFSIWWNKDTRSATLKEKTMAGMAWLLRQDYRA